MKKLMIAAIAIAFAAVAQAAALDWKVTGASATKDYSVYFMLTAAVADSYANVSEIAATTLNGGSGTVVNSGRTFYVEGSIDDASLAKSSELSMVIVNADASKYAVISGLDTSKIYDPGNQESSLGALAIINAQLVGATYKDFGGGEAIPEPTSALMLVMGLAGLALKRKVA